MATWQHTSGHIKETPDNTPPDPMGWSQIVGALEDWPSDHDRAEQRQQLDSQRSDA